MGGERFRTDSAKLTPGGWGPPRRVYTRGRTPPQRARADANPLCGPVNWTEAGAAAYYNNITENYHSERKVPRGGILADEMGLGKTISVVALLRCEQSANQAPQAGNLIVAPLSLLGAWQGAAACGGNPLQRGGDAI